MPSLSSVLATSWPKSQQTLIRVATAVVPLTPLRAILALGERSVRQRLDEIETRMDSAETLCRGQGTRLLYLEAYTKVVLRGSAAVSDFLKDKDRDVKLAKQAFIASFIAELKEKAFPEATHVIEEAEGLLCEAWARPLIESSGSRPPGRVGGSPIFCQLLIGIFPIPICVF